MSDENKDDKKVEFTAEQQVKVQELIDKAHSSGLKKQHDELAKANTEAERIKAELEAAKAELTAVKTAVPTKASKNEAEQLQAQIEEMKTVQKQTFEEQTRLRQSLLAKETEINKAREETTNVRKANLIQQEAAKAGFVSPDLIAKVTQDDLHWDAARGKFVVLGTNGEPRLNTAYEEMTPAEFYKEYAAANPYLVRSDVKHGSGSLKSNTFGGSSDGKLEVKQVFGKDSSSVLAAKLHKDSPADYKRMKAQAQEMGLIPK